VRTIRIGQRAPRDLAAKAEVIQLRSHRSQASFDIAQAFAKRQLRKCEAQELIAAREATWPTIATPASYARMELTTRQEIHQLREHELTVEHKTSLANSAKKLSPRQGSNVLAISSRVHSFLVASGYRSVSYLKKCPH
jgi:hypothetical protein